VTRRRKNLHGKDIGRKTRSARRLKKGLNKRAEGRSVQVVSEDTKQTQETLHEASAKLPESKETALRPTCRRSKKKSADRMDENKPQNNWVGKLTYKNFSEGGDGRQS